MTNTLKKTTSIQTMPAISPTSEQPGRPARPAWTEITTQRVCTIQPPTVYRQRLVFVLGEWVRVPVNELVPGSGGLVCRDVVNTVFHPAEPARPYVPGTVGRPASTTSDYRLGWNAGARSVDTLEEDGAATFTVPNAVGVVVGFNDLDQSVGYSDIDHGLLFAKSKVKVLEAGAEVPGTTSNFAPTDTFKIERKAGVVRYFNGGTLLYTSAVPSVGEAFLDASMYSGGDAVDSPSFVAAAGESGFATTSFREPAGIAGQGSYNTSSGSLRPLTGTASIAPRSAAAFAPLSGLASNRLYGSARCSFIPLTGDSFAGVPPEYALSNVRLLPMAGFSTGLTGTIGGVDDTFSLLTGLAADRPYAQASNTLSELVGFSADAAFLQTPTSLPKPTLVSFGGAAGLFAMRLPELEASGVLGEPNCFTGSAPLPSLTAFGGATARPAAPRAQLVASGTTVAIGRAQLLMSLPTLEASGLTGSVGKAPSLQAAMPNLVGYGGAILSATIGSATLVASGLSGAVGRTAAALSLPLFELTASGTAEAYGRAELIGPALIPSPSGLAYLVAPRATLTAIGTAVVVVTATDFEAYAVNLTSTVEAGGNEVTRYTNYPFTRIVRFQNSYFGLAADGLYLLEGTTDDGVPIPWELCTHTMDFGSPKIKNVASGYLSGRIGPESKFTVHAGERLDVSYTYTTPRGPTAQNHRQKFGRGLLARYFAFELAGDGELSVDELDFEVGDTKRRI